VPEQIHGMVTRCKHSELIFRSIRSKFGLPQSVVELGCGDGGNLARFGPKTFSVGIEPFKLNFDRAGKVVSSGRVIRGDHRSLVKFNSNQFDVGFTCSVLDHIENFEPALLQLLRIARNLFLLEPYIPGVQRKSTKGETRYWKTTWYHDYVRILKEISEKGFISYEVTSHPLYPRNSGPLYHKFFIECSGVIEG